MAMSVREGLDGRRGETEAGASRLAEGLVELRALLGLQDGAGSGGQGLLLLSERGGGQQAEQRGSGGAQQEIGCGCLQACL